MFFKCKVCQEKDKRIEDLKDEVSYLRSLYRNPAPDLSTLEMNKVLDGASFETQALPVVEVPSSNPAEREELEYEFNRILSGNF